ncbi:MAG: sel1 repeat family protein [Kordiimonadaceae bacterium]|nr:sel1 repeat family protein [Kordiimonadaceae bacterium]
MQFTLKFLVLIKLPTSVADCSYSIANCNYFSGTTKYNTCVASQGDKEIQNQLGLTAYHAGDMNTAIKWLKKAAEPVSDDKLMYMPAVGGQKYGTVMRIPDKNPVPGHRGAQGLLARIYAEGIGVKKNEKKSKHYREM